MSEPQELVFFEVVAVKSGHNRIDQDWFGANLVELKQLNTMNLNLSSIVVEPVDTVRDINVILDTKLSMQEIISKIS